ncbi:MAG: manganese efflux pump MntP family protein [Sulfurospirillaceae bacterium]|jgi:putative Mn2+ efflux pump MntP|nr:manganese efflux pump MntP family protein [Sulfurospirillaceae bacterium]MDD2827281.1 manganese efflux pump MntP family protein [Sulfurospirillaceae bacterium]
MLDVIILAFALSMDAFAVSIGLGAKKHQTIVPIALRAGLFFGCFQALMPLFGYLGGKGLLGWVDSYTSWIAFGLLVLIGGKMVYEGLSEGIEEVIQNVSNKVLLLLAIATSIDAMAAGFSLILLPFNPLLACVIIGVVTFAMSFVGVYIGKYSGTWLEGKAEVLGGIVLVLIGFRMLFL